VGRSLWREDGFSRLRVPWDLRPYFTVSDLRLPFSSYPILAGSRWRYSIMPPHGILLCHFSSVFSVCCIRHSDCLDETFSKDSVSRFRSYGLQRVGCHRELTRFGIRSHPTRKAKPRTAGGGGGRSRLSGIASQYEKYCSQLSTYCKRRMAFRSKRTFRLCWGQLERLKPRKKTKERPWWPTITQEIPTPARTFKTDTANKPPPPKKHKLNTCSSRTPK
jgi:hypothetical protein